MLSDGNLPPFERVAEAVAEEADLAFRPDTDPTGVGARSAGALTAVLREFAATYAGIGADPRSAGRAPALPLPKHRHRCSRTT